MSVEVIHQVAVEIFQFGAKGLFSPLQEKKKKSCFETVQLNPLTSLIISISLKVRRSSQSTFTMWPCRWAFVSWTENERRIGETRKGFTEIPNNKEFAVSQHGG